MTLYRFNPKSEVVIVRTKFTLERGSVNARLILDTGATYTALRPDLVHKLGCDPKDTTKNRIVTASGIEYVSFVTIPRIKALGHECENVRACVHDLPDSLPADGLLGMSFLRKFRIHIDFPKGEIELF